MRPLKRFVREARSTPNLLHSNPLLLKAAGEAFYDALNKQVADFIQNDRINGIFDTSHAFFKDEHIGHKFITMVMDVLEERFIEQFVHPFRKFVSNLNQTSYTILAHDMGQSGEYEV